MVYWTIGLKINSVYNQRKRKWFRYT